MQPSRIAPIPARLVCRWLTFGLAFWGCAELGHFLSFLQPHSVATFWPAGGLFLAALAMSPKQHWGGYVATAVVANGLIEALGYGRGVALVAAFCTANTLEALTGAVLLQLVHRRPFRVETMSDVLWLVGIGALAAPLVGAAIGGVAMTEALGGKSFWYNVRMWWMADGIGVLAVAPLLLSFPAAIPWTRLREPKRWLEAAATALLVILSSLVAFGPKLPLTRDLPAYPFIVAPFLIWCGLRFGQFGTAVGVFLAALVSVWGTTRDHGLFAHMEQTVEMQAAALQVYVMVVTVTPLLFATSIEQQRKAEAVLRASEARARAMFEMAADAIIWIDDRGTIEAFNPSAERMFGYRAAAILGKNVKTLMPEPYCRQHDEYLANYLRTGQRKILGATRELEGLRGDGTIFPLELMVSEVLLGDRRTFTGVVRDITERRAAQQSLQSSKQELEQRVAERTSELVDANQRLRLEMSERSRAEERLREQQTHLAHAARLSSLGEMAAEMAHELNQPLSAITNYVRGTQRRSRSGQVAMDEILSMLEIIDKEATRAAEVIRRTKDFVRKQPISRQPLEIGAVVSEALEAVGHELRERCVQLEMHMDHKLPQCAGDSLQLQQVVVNLVLNAADALLAVPAHQRQICLSVAGRDDHLELTVEDNGPGIAPETANRVFDAFFSTKPEGLGLGLPISRGIIEDHGGKLWAERGVRGGACLRFTLPVWEGPDDGVTVEPADRLRGG